MDDNNVRDLVEFSKGLKQVVCKQVFKTKRDLKVNLKDIKVDLSPKVSLKRIVFTIKKFFLLFQRRNLWELFWIYDLNLPQMDVNTAFLNGDLEEKMYITQHEGFLTTWKDSLVCKLNKSIYGLKQAYRKWHLKFKNIALSYGFV